MLKGGIDLVQDALENARVKSQKVKDLDLLYEIYQRQTLTIEQLRKLYFSNSKKYVYRKVEILKSKGWIETKGWYRYGVEQKSAPCYLTQDGITALLLKGYIPDARHWTRNLPSKDRHKLILDFNEAHAELRNYGYTFVDSRSWKEQTRLKRNNLCHGGVITPDGEHYTVYLLEDHTRESTIRRVKNEIAVISEGKQSGQYMMFFHGDNAREKYMKYDGMQKEKGLLSFCMIDYGAIYKKLKLLKSGWFREQLRQRGYQNIVDAGQVESMVECKNQDTYFTSFVHFDVARLRQLSNYYSSGYLYSKHKLVVLCWWSMAKSLRNKIGRPGKIEVISISEEDFGEEVNN